MPSAVELDRRKTVGINDETVTNITSTDFPGHYPGEDAAWNIDKFAAGLSVKFHKNEYDEAIFSLVGVDASIANAFRRILLAEVPTLAIETCYVHNNTSVIADEVLAHRLGLVPLKGALEGMNKLKWYIKPDEEHGVVGMGGPSDYNTVQIDLKVKCEWKPNPPDEGEPEEKYNHSNVYASDLVFKPIGRQVEWFKELPPQPVNPKILLAKLRPGQEIEVEMHAHLGKGADHAKFSPVGTATYRLLPKIDILRPILGQDAEKFQGCFPNGVIDVRYVDPKAIKEDPRLQGHEGEKYAVVKDPMKDTVSRECLRHKEFTTKDNEKVKLGRVQDHFIFQVESTGQFASDDLFLQSVKVLKYKAKELFRALDKMEHNEA